MPHEPNRALARAKLETLAWEQTPDGRRGRSGSRREVLLDTTEGTGMVPLGELTDNQLRRYIGPVRLEEAGDMRKNGRGIYSGTAAKNGDYVIYKKGGTYHPASARYYVDRVDAGGTHQTIGTTRGFSTIADAIQGARDNAHTRGGKNGVIFEQRGDELVQVHAISAHRKNARRPSSSLGLGEDLDLLRQFVEMAAESMELPNYKDADVTPAVIRVAKEYDAALRWTLDEVVMRFPPKNGATADDLWNANAPYLVLMTLREEGVGIWDGDWDEFYTALDIKRVQKLLERKLGLYTSSGGGEGKLGDAISNAASETCGDPDYSPNASRRREEPDETAARELSLYIENEYSLVGSPNSQGKTIEKKSPP